MSPAQTPIDTALWYWELPRMRTLAVISIGLILGCQTSKQKSEESDPSVVDVSVEEEPAHDVNEIEGDKAWQERTEEASLRQAIALWTKALEVEPNDALWVKLSRAHYLLAEAYLFEESAEALAQRSEHFLLGHQAAFEALKLSAPEFVSLKKAGAPLKEALQKAGATSAAALYWYSVNIGRWSRLEGPLWVMRHKDEVRFNMERVRRLDATFYYAAPERYFGALEAATLGLLGGSLTKSEDAFERALSLAPEYLGNKVVYAEFLAVAKKDRPLFERLLQEVISADAANCEKCVQENVLEQQKAKRLLAQVEVLF